MDEGTKVDNTVPWKIEEVDDNGYVFRQILHFQRISNRNKKYPGESHFMLRPGEESLSFNWERYIDVEKNYKLIGITFSKDKYLDHTAFKIFKFSVAFLKSLVKFNKISHSPTYHGLPSPVGLPNNKSHVSFQCDLFDEGIRAELSDYCLENFDHSNCDFDVKLIRSEIEELRARGNDTPYHQLWDFEESDKK